MITFLFMMMGLLGMGAIIYTLILAERKLMRIYHVFIAFVGILSFSISIAMTGKSISWEHPDSIHSKKFNIKIDIKQELLNSKVISTDTVYSFIPKKK